MVTEIVPKFEVVLVHKFGTIFGVRIVGTEKVKAGFTKKSDAEMWMKQLEKEIIKNER